MLLRFMFMPYQAELQFCLWNRDAAMLLTVQLCTKPWKAFVHIESMFIKMPCHVNLRCSDLGYYPI